MSKPSYNGYKEQVYYLEVLQHVGTNVVNCGNCGTVLLVDCSKSEHYCWKCGIKDDHCHFPDIYYERSQEDFESDVFEDKPKYSDEEVASMKTALATYFGIAVEGIDFKSVEQLEESVVFRVFRKRIVVKYQPEDNIEAYTQMNNTRFWFRWI